MGEINETTKALACELRSLMEYGTPKIMERAATNPGGPGGAKAEVLILSAALEALAQRLDVGATPDQVAITYVNAVTTLNALFLGVLIMGTSSDPVKNAMMEPVATEVLLQDIAEGTRRKMTQKPPAEPAP